MGNLEVLVKQRIKTYIQAGSGFAIAAVVVAIAFAGMASAQTATNTANTLKVSPVRTDITVKPGDSRTVQTTVTNLTDAPINVRPVSNDFVAGDEEGAPALILEDGEYAKSHSLKRFMGPLKDLVIPAKQSVAVDVEVNVPANAQAGGYFGAVRFAPVKPDDGGEVNMSASVASLILLTVPGDLVEKLELASFDIQQNGQVGTYFSNPKDLSAFVRFKNGGNVQVAPFGKVSVTKGSEVVYETDFNSEAPKGVVLPESARRWNIALNDIGNFGKYTVNATFTYGEKNQTIEVQKSFWVIPTAAIIAAVVGLLLLVGIGVGIWYFLRRYKQRIINEHGRSGRTHINK